MTKFVYYSRFLRGCLNFVFDAEKARLFVQIDAFFKPKDKI